MTGKVEVVRLAERAALWRGLRWKEGVLAEAGGAGRAGAGGWEPGGARGPGGGVGRAAARAAGRLRRGALARREGGASIVPGSGDAASYGAEEEDRIAPGAPAEGFLADPAPPGLSCCARPPRGGDVAPFLHLTANDKGREITPSGIPELWRSLVPILAERSEFPLGWEVGSENSLQARASMDGSSASSFYCIWRRDGTFTVGRFFSLT